MTTYRITTPTHDGELVVNDDSLICQASDVFDWAIGREWVWFRNYCDLKGWQICPRLENKGHVIEIEHDGVVYELLWRAHKCVRITRHEEGEEPEDVTSEELPEDVREMIE